MQAHTQGYRYAIYHSVGNGKSNSIAIRLSQGNGFNGSQSSSKLTDWGFAVKALDHYRYLLSPFLLLSSKPVY